jgi:hypothetical protein
MENNKRVFVFGCSMVNYCWPTWADILGRSLHNQGYEYYNLGIAGTGNRAITSTLYRAKHEFAFTDQDIIIVMWSSWNREDRYLPVKRNPEQGFYWTVEGNVLNSAHYDDDFILKHWSLENDIIQNIISIKSARSLVDFAFEGSIDLYEHGLTESESDLDPLLGLFCDVKLPNTMPQLCDIPVPEHPVNRADGHPSLPAAMWYLDNIVLPAMGIELDNETIRWVRSTDKFIEELCNSGLDWPIIQDKLTEFHLADMKTYRMDLSSQDLWSSWGDGVEEFLISFLQETYNHKWVR